MREVFFLAPALAAGLVLGAFFFGGLWWTVGKGLASPHPALWFFASMLVRTSVTLAGFYFVGREEWQRWLLCLFGFVLARMVVKRLTRPRIENQSAATSGARYAP
jgi:F1F0 ATPase subunit 2